MGEVGSGVGQADRRFLRERRMGASPRRPTPDFICLLTCKRYWCYGCERDVDGLAAQAENDLPTGGMCHDCVDAGLADDLRYQGTQRHVRPSRWSC